MARIVEWQGQPFALLVEGATGDYLVPPIIRDKAGRVVEGAEVLEAVAESGRTVPLPVIEGAGPEVLAMVDQAMAELSAKLGVPIGPPDPAKGLRLP